jgi:hypothetical protein
MKPRSLLVLAAAFAVSFFVIGWPYWQVAYAQVSLPETLLGWPILVVVAAAAAACVARANAFAVFLIVGAAVPSAVLARVIFDTAVDPTSHNLWPFEIVLAGMLGFAVALAGIVVGLVVAKAVPGLRKGG